MAPALSPRTMSSSSDLHTKQAARRVGANDAVCWCGAALLATNSRQTARTDACCIAGCHSTAMPATPVSDWGLAACPYMSADNGSCLKAARSLLYLQGEPPQAVDCLGQLHCVCMRVPVQQANAGNALVWIRGRAVYAPGAGHDDGQLAAAVLAPDQLAHLHRHRHCGGVSIG